MKNTLIALGGVVIIVTMYVVFARQATAPATPDTSDTLTSTDEGRIRGPEEATLSVGQSAVIAGMSVRLNKVNDSRCAEDVQCIWAGTVTASVELSLNGETQIVDVGLDTPVEFGGYRVSLVGVTPARGKGPMLEPERYQLTFRVASIIGSDGVIPANI